MSLEKYSRVRALCECWALRFAHVNQGRIRYLFQRPIFVIFRNWSFRIDNHEDIKYLHFYTKKLLKSVEIGKASKFLHYFQFLQNDNSNPNEIDRLWWKYVFYCEKSVGSFNQGCAFKLLLEWFSKKKTCGPPIFTDFGKIGLICAQLLDRFILFSLHYIKL